MSDKRNHEDSKSLTREDKEYIRGAIPDTISFVKNNFEVRSRLYAKVSARTKELLDKACEEGKEITPELEEKISNQVKEEFKDII